MARHAVDLEIRLVMSSALKPPALVKALEKQMAVIFDGQDGIVLQGVKARARRVESA